MIISSAPQPRANTASPAHNNAGFQASLTQQTLTAPQNNLAWDIAPLTDDDPTWLEHMIHQVEDWAEDTLSNFEPVARETLAQTLAFSARAVHSIAEPAMDVQSIFSLAKQSNNNQPIEKYSPEWYRLIEKLKEKGILKSKPKVKKNPKMPQPKSQRFALPPILDAIKTTNVLQTLGSLTIGDPGTSPDITIPTYMTSAVDDAQREVERLEKEVLRIRNKGKDQKASEEEMLAVEKQLDRARTALRKAKKKEREQQSNPSQFHLASTLVLDTMTDAAQAAWNKIEQNPVPVIIAGSALLLAAGILAWPYIAASAPSWLPGALSFAIVA